MATWFMLYFSSLAQQRIDRTRHLVRHRHSGNIETTPLHQFFGPATGMIGFLVDIPQYRTGTVDEKGTQIHISTLADPQQGWPASRGVLSRYQSKECGQLSAILELTDITDTRYQCRGSLGANSGNAKQ